jgi:hypothetical protein
MGFGSLLMGMDDEDEMIIYNEKTTNAFVLLCEHVTDA